MSTLPAVLTDTPLPTDYVKKDLYSADLLNQVSACHACPLQEYNKTILQKNFHASVVIVSLYPEELSQHTDEGRQFYQLLLNSGLSADDLHFTSIAKCKYGNPHECRSFLEQELILIQPKVVLFLGYEAASFFFNPDAPGLFVPIDNKTSYYSTYSYKEALSSDLHYQWLVYHLSQLANNLN